jgi:uncharacterized caspase-like protein
MDGRVGAFAGMLLTIILVCFGAPTNAHADNRVALVIGNGAYQNAPILPNPPNDADDVGAALARLGFSVQKVANAGFNDMRVAMLEFNRRVRGADLAVVFYAGYGIEVGGENYLIPVDAELKTDADVDNETIKLKTMVMAVSGASELGLVILDACRNSPFANTMRRTSTTRAVGHGLAPVESAKNVLVAYAAKDGTTASDGNGHNSPFTAALLKYLETPGLEINFLFRDVRDEVLAATNHEQQPFVYGSLSKRAIYLKSAPEISSKDAGIRADETVWSTIKDSNDPNLFAEFLNKFPGSAHNDDARAAMGRLSVAKLRPLEASTQEPGASTSNPVPRPGLVTDCDRAAAPSDPQRPHGVAGVAIERIDIREAVAACDDAMSLAPKVARFSFQRGRVALAAKDYQRARQLFETAAALGSGSAMVDLGLQQEAGTGVPANFNAARRWFERAADLGTSAAMVNLGALYEHSQGVNRDDREARRWYEQAAAKGNFRGMTAIGSLYERGRGVPKDDAEARQWYEKAANLGDELAMRQLGALYEHGLGVPKSMSEARKWYERAAAAGDNDAKGLLRALRSK